MPERVHDSPSLIFSIGTQVVLQTDVLGPDGKLAHLRGSVGMVIDAPTDRNHSYRIRFLDGLEAALKHHEIVMLAKHQEGDIGNQDAVAGGLHECIIYRCVIGSQAYGLAGDGSDVDRRGIYLPPANLHWSLYGVPEQLENDATQEVYWELQKFLILALKANPNVLECLYSPMIEKTIPLAEELLGMRSIFLSRLVYQTYNGYVMSQFKKMQADIRNHGQVKWKHVMHLIRLLMSGVEVLRSGEVQVHVGEQRDRLLSIRRGEVAWDEIEQWRKDLHCDFDSAYEQTRLPERPDYERANAFLIRARRNSL